MNVRGWVVLFIPMNDCEFKYPWFISITLTFLHKILGGDMEYTKTIMPTIRQVLPYRRVRGSVEDFTTDAYVLLLEEKHICAANQYVFSFIPPCN